MEALWYIINLVGSFMVISESVFDYAMRISASTGRTFHTGVLAFALFNVFANYIGLVIACGVFCVGLSHGRSKWILIAYKFKNIATLALSIWGTIACVSNYSAVGDENLPK